MSDMPHLRMVNKGRDREVLEWAATEGFSSLFEFPPSSPQSLFSCLGLSVVLHSIMPTGRFRAWVQNTWSTVDAVRQIQNLSKPAPELKFSRPEFWRDLTAVVRRAAAKCHGSKGQAELAAKVESGACGIEGILSGLEALCSILCLELYVYRLNARGEKIVDCYNGGNENVRCFTVVAAEGSSFHFLLHELFRESLVPSLEGHFPFKTNSPRRVLHSPASTTVSVEAEEKLISTLLGFIKQQRLGGVASQYEECISACEEYACSRDSKGQAPMDLSLPKSPPSQPHALEDCSKHGGLESVQLDCLDQFHKDCLLARLASDFFRHRDAGHSPRLECPLCSASVTGDALGRVSEQLREETEREQIQAKAHPRYKRCENCRCARDAQVVISHSGLHDVCAACLRSSSCPICRKALNPSDQKFVTHCFE